VHIPSQGFGELPPDPRKFEEALGLREADDEVEVTVGAGFPARKGTNHRRMDDAVVLQDREDLPREFYRNPTVCMHENPCDHSFPLEDIIDTPETPPGWSAEP